MDDFNREALAIEIDFNLPKPRRLRELISVALTYWAEQYGVTLEFIKQEDLSTATADLPGDAAEVRIRR